MAQKKDMKFEEAFAKLIEISNILEKGDKGIEESVNLYAESVELRKFCEDFIEKTKLKIQSINESFEK